MHHVLAYSLINMTLAIFLLNKIINFDAAQHKIEGLC